MHYYAVCDMAFNIRGQLTKRLISNGISGKQPLQAHRPAVAHCIDYLSS